ncbi:MAG TPA: hypothetical protein VNJ31_04750 [Methyloceanibacter sp.]|nr:hypothetical protein [Methyloceanibacter sp.]
MPSGSYFFMVWAHRSASSLFGASVSPVMRNGKFLCFESEAKARAEADRLNARSGGSHVHYSVKPTLIQMALPNKPADGEPADSLAMPLSGAGCRVAPRSF